MAGEAASDQIVGTSLLAHRPILGERVRDGPPSERLPMRLKSARQGSLPSIIAAQATPTHRRQVALDLAPCEFPHHYCFPPRFVDLLFDQTRDLSTVNAGVAGGLRYAGRTGREKVALPWRPELWSDNSAQSKTWRWSAIHQAQQLVSTLD
jgi:hypothetical protein